MLPHWRDNTVMVNGVALHYTRTGDGSKPPLVLAHGFSDHGLCWLPVARDLEANYDVFLPDARGHGKSARVQPGDTLDLAADLAGLIRALGLERPIVGGHSMGADTSAKLEARFPGLASALLLEDPPWFEPEPPKDPAQTPPPRRDWITPLLALTTEEIAAKCHADNPTWPEVELLPWAQSKQQFDLNFRHLAGGMLSDWGEVAQKIDCPALLITADNEMGAIVTPASAQKAASLNPRLRVAHVANAGHSIRRENYPAYMAAVTGFLKTLSR